MSDVILLSHGFQSEYEIGFANGLARNGVRVLLVGSDTTLVGRAEDGVQIVNLRGSQDRRRSRSAKVFNILRYQLRYLALLLARRGTPVHQIGLFSTGSSVLGLLEAWLTRICAGPFVMTVHNLLPHDRHTRANRAIHRAIYRAPGMLMVHTRRVAQLLSSEFGVEPARIQVVEHGFDRSFAPDPQLRSQERARLGIPETAPLMLFFGQVVRYKGLDLLLAAFAQMAGTPGARLLIAGPCRDAALARELRERIAGHAWRERITWLEGFVPDAQVPALLQAADCMVMPYRYIDQSGVLFMAMSAGLPIVATDVGSLAEFIRPEGGAVVPPNDPVALARALEAVLASPFDRARLVAAATRYEWRHTVRAVLPAYAQGGGRAAAVERG